jgi:hypothetical protein
MALTSRALMGMDNLDDDDFNSSDIELPEPPSNPYAHFGQESIEKLLDRATEHRIMTKVQVKQLSDNTGAITTLNGRQLWNNRFKAFCQATLKHK